MEFDDIPLMIYHGMWGYPLFTSFHTLGHSCWWIILVHWGWTSYPAGVKSLVNYLNKTIWKSGVFPFWNVIIFDIGNTCWNAARFFRMVINSMFLFFRRYIMRIICYDNLFRFYSHDSGAKLWANRQLLASLGGQAHREQWQVGCGTLQRWHRDTPRNDMFIWLVVWNQIWLIYDNMI